MINDKIARYRFRHVESEICFDQGEGQVDAGSDTCRSPDVPVFDIDPVGIDRYAWEPGLQQRRPAPVRRRAVAIQYARLGQVKGACADAGYALRDGRKRFKQADSCNLLLLEDVRFGPTDDDDGIAMSSFLRSKGLYREASAAENRSACAGD